MSLVQDVDLVAVAPPLIVSVTALLVLVADAVAPVPRAWLTGGGVTGVLAALASTFFLAGQDRGTFCVGGSCSYQVDEFTVLFQVVMLLAAALVLLMAHREVRDTAIPAGEFTFLLLAALTGAMTLAAARDLTTMVIAFEVLSLPSFGLVALRRYDGRSSSAGLTMLLVSVTSTAVMLFGISLIYGVTGTLFLDGIADALAAPGRYGEVAAVGMVLVLVGFAFKVAAVPFHFWAPDTYLGAPIAVAAFLAVVSKAAGFAGIILVLTVAFAPLSDVWGPVVAVLAALTMTVGNLVALRQGTAMRLLAWSSIAQAGYVLAPLGAAAGASSGAAFDELAAAAAGYVAIYAAMSIGVFAVIAFVGWIGRVGGGSLDDYRGLFRTHPAMALALALFLCCLAGLPPGLAGLFGKIVIFRGVVTGGYEWLAVVLAVNTVLALYYYLSWASKLFGPRRERVTALAPVPAAVSVAVAAAASAILLMSLAPQVVLGIVPTGAGG